MSRSAFLAVGFSLALSAAPASAQDDYRYGRLRTVEPGVALQRASEAAAEVAASNMPFLPGDRVWTDERGRLEIQFADGSVLRLDGRSKLDYLGQEGGRRADRVVLRLWSGSLFFHFRELRRSPDYVIETPEGVLEPQARGAYRLDVGPGEARVLVLEGEASVEAGRRLRVSSGHQVLIREGEAEGGAERFHASDADDEFARWDADLQQQMAYADGRQEWLPEEVSPYAGEFEEYGAWDRHAEYGYVWYPRVDTGWRPYTNGHWAWTSYGWTWVPNERWGWAAFHYGRWGFGHGRGWYWIPGRSWGPAWVSWSRGGDYVGWCPLGYGDRPVVIHEARRLRGHAVPRGSRVHASTITTPWFYVHRNDMGQRDLARRRVASERLPTTALRAVPVGAGRLTRDLRVVDAGSAGSAPLAGGSRAVPRNVRTKPMPGDTTPELRADPMTTIPHPVARRRPRREPEEEQATGSGGEAAAPGATAPVRALPRSPNAAPWRGEAAQPQPQAQPAPEPEASSGGSWRERLRTRPRSQEPPPREAGEAREREVLRPLFGGLGRPRRDESGSGSRPESGAVHRGGSGSSRPERPPVRTQDGGSERPRGGGVSRPSGGDAGRAQAPPPQSAPRSQGGGERARPRPKDNN